MHHVLIEHFQFSFKVCVMERHPVIRVNDQTQEGLDQRGTAPLVPCLVLLWPLWALLWLSVLWLDGTFGVQRPTEIGY